MPAFHCLGSTSTQVLRNLTVLTWSWCCLIVLNTPLNICVMPLQKCREIISIWVCAAEMVLLTAPSVLDCKD